jgi:hypothetical protein
MTDSIPLRAIRAKVDAYDKTLLATDPRFGRKVTLIHEDGSVLHFDSAFMMRVDKIWIAVFTEHHGTHVYHVEDLTSYEQLQAIPKIDTLPV